MKLFSRPSLRKRESRLPLLLCFLLPFLSVTLGFTLFAKLFGDQALYPFGDGMTLAHDGWHQYYPFFAEFRDKLTSGGSLQYTWSIGMGTGYASLFAYYLASPLNLLCLLIPEYFMPELFAFLTFLKLGLAGLFMGVFLRTVFRRNDASLPFFALAYGLCAWASGYYWNHMWLDAFALLPLLVAGTVCLLREGKYRLYVLALALTLWSNYYIAYFCCIFVLICFVGYNLICWDGLLNLLRRFARIAVTTLVAVGLTAVLLLPTLYAMQHTYAAKSNERKPLALNLAEGANGVTSQGQSMADLFAEQTLPGLAEAGKKVAGNLMTNPAITKMEGLPNVFCGLSTVLLAVYFLCCKTVKLREKLFSVFLLLFLTASFIFRELDYIWHGFHFPNMLPYRFSFLYSFVLICMAFRAYTQIEHMRKWHLAVLLAAAALLFYNLLGVKDVTVGRLVVSGLVLAGMAVYFLLGALPIAKPWRRTAASVLLFAILSGEMGLCFFLGAEAIGFTTRSTYPKEQAGVEALLAYTRETSGDRFWRTEVSATQTLNDGALNGYNGISVFTSSANVNFNRFSRSLGLSSWPGSNRFSYYEASPFTNTMVALRYILDRDGGQLNPRYNRFIASSDGVKLLECDSYISLGFMTESSLAEFVTEKERYDPMAEQEEMFSLATGLDGTALYRKLRFSSSVPAKDCTLTGGDTQFSYDAAKAAETSDLDVHYSVKEAGMYCVSAQSATVKEVKVYRNGSHLCTRNLRARALFAVGEFQAGDELTLTFPAEAGKKGSFSATVARFDAGLYDEGFALLADEPWVLTEASDTCLRGTIEAKQAGLFYTSIPYENGWTATVDGRPVELAASYDSLSERVKLTDAVICFPLAAGAHEVVLEFTAPGLALGGVISGVSLLCLAALLWFFRRTLLPDRPRARPAPAPEGEPEDAVLEDFLFRRLLEEAVEAEHEASEAEEAPDEAPEEGASEAEEGPDEASEEGASETEEGPD